MRALVLLLALGACGPTLTIYERTAPTRVEVTKQATPARLRFAARRNGDEIELIAKRASEVRISRVVHYGAATLERHGGNPLVKLVELPIGLLFLAVGPTMWETPLQYENTATSKMTIDTNWLIAMVSPFQTAIGYRIRANPTTTADVFKDPPIVRELEVRLPAPGLAVRYRALDVSAKQVVGGDLTTDAFGRASIAGAATAIAIEVTVDGVTQVIPIND